MFKGRKYVSKTYSAMHGNNIYLKRLTLARGNDSESLGNKIGDWAFAERTKYVPRFIASVEVVFLEADDFAKLKNLDVSRANHLSCLLGILVSSSLGFGWWIQRFPAVLFPSNEDNTFCQRYTRGTILVLYNYDYECAILGYKLLL